MSEARVHHKQPTSTLVWLLERGSPAEYVGNENGCPFVTSDPWRAIRFESQELAEEWFRTRCPWLGTFSAVDHIFITP